MGFPGNKDAPRQLFHNAERRAEEILVGGREGNIGDGKSGRVKPSQQRRLAIDIGVIAVAANGLLVAPVGRTSIPLMCAEIVAVTAPCVITTPPAAEVTRKAPEVTSVKPLMYVLDPLFVILSVVPDRIAVAPLTKDTPSSSSAAPDAKVTPDTLPPETNSSPPAVSVVLTAAAPLRWSRSRATVASKATCQ
jgi:hypothetical protein